MFEVEAFAILSTVPYLGAAKIRLLIRQFGSAVEAIRAPVESLKTFPGFTRIAPYWKSWEKESSWKQNLVLAERLGATLIPFTSPTFPKALEEIPDPPALLYVRGEWKSQDRRSIAVVGTRNATIYGNEMAYEISRQLALRGFTVVSGLARGVDTAAHRGALEQGRTVAVIGSGLADIYPSENQSLAEKIVERGALISEFPMSTPPDRQNFPQRNRIVSGLTLGTLLVEAPVKSGAMLTMERAYSQKKPLFALPGRADSDNFRGNHLLIKQGQARLVESADDVAAHFETLFPLPVSQPARMGSILDAEEKLLIDKMPEEEVSIEELALMVPSPIQQINRVLMSLILKKAVKEFPGKIYKKLPGLK